jgi:2-dehydropantoate 2-reductase
VLLFEANGEPLPMYKGGTFRLLTPGLNDLCANVKGVGRIELRVGPGKDTRPPAEERTHC